MLNFWKMQKELTEEQLAGKLALIMGDVDSIDITKEATQEIYKIMGTIDGLLDHLKDTMVKDIQRYFAIPDGPTGDHDRAVIRGAFARTSYFRSLILTEPKK